MPTIEDIIKQFIEKIVEENIAARLSHLQQEITRLETQKPLLLRVSDVTQMLHLSRTEVYDMLNRGELPGFKHGRARMIPYWAVEAYIERKLDETKQQRIA